MSPNPDAAAPPRPALPDLSEAVALDDRGLVAVVSQDAATGEVLTLAWASAEALRITAESGELTLWSRSRQKLWRKGETSGNVQRVVALRLDCDRDAVLALVEPAGPACHTGARTCFHPFRTPGGPEGDHLPATELVAHEVLPDLERVLDERDAARPEGSYAARLLADPAFAAEKVREEAEEVGRAVADEPDERVDNEAADVLFHLLALVRSRGRRLADVAEVLRGRRG